MDIPKENNVEMFDKNHFDNKGKMAKPRSKSKNYESPPKYAV